jgi:hypothetical protein
MTTEQQEAFDAVEKINEELFEKYDKLNIVDNYKDWISAMPILSITFAGMYMFISLSIPSVKNIMPEIQIYNSEDNDRIFYEKSNKYETYYKFIKRKFIEIKKEINSIKL